MVNLKSISLISRERVYALYAHVYNLFHGLKVASFRKHGSSDTVKHLDRCLVSAHARTEYIRLLLISVGKERDGSMAPRVASATIYDEREREIEREREGKGEKFHGTRREIR